MLTIKQTRAAEQFKNTSLQGLKQFSIEIMFTKWEILGRHALHLTASYDLALACCPRWVYLQEVVTPRVYPQTLVLIPARLISHTPKTTFYSLSPNITFNSTAPKDYILTPTLKHFYLLQILHYNPRWTLQFPLLTLHAPFNPFTTYSRTSEHYSKPNWHSLWDGQKEKLWKL